MSEYELYELCMSIICISWQYQLIYMGSIIKTQIKEQMVEAYQNVLNI